MKPAWRGFVYRGEVWAWPMLLWDHTQALMAWDTLLEATCRWRQWEPGGPVTFDDDCSEEDKAKVMAWLEALDGAS